MAEPLDNAQAIARRRERHWTMLVVAIVVVVFAVVLQVRDDQRVEFQACPGYPLPESCMTKVLFHRDCPGCGLTRSFVFLAHGQVSRSLAIHRVGWLLALAVVFQIPYRCLLLRKPNQSPSPIWARFFGGVLIVVLFGNWLFNQIYHVLK